MTKSNILKIATQEFSIHGYDAVSMNKLAAKLEVNKATIYYHYKDKRSLYQEVLTSLIHINREKNNKIINSDINPKEKFRQYIKLFVETIKEHPQIVSISLREMANLGSNVDSTMANDFKQEMLDIKNIVLQLNLKERYKKLDFYELKSLIMGTVNTYYSIQMSHLELDGINDFENNSDKVLDYTIDFLSNILLDALCE
ncbi:MAG: TetR/AcrR family transcriptional regulator [Campylobacterota bacterium]|nr:TetR/AcrR family transcriptional regulator [Campylobacterota bacterium]